MEKQKGSLHMVFDDFNRIRKTILGNVSITNDNHYRFGSTTFKKVFGETFQKRVSNLLRLKEEVEEDRENFKKILTSNGIEVVDVSSVSLQEVLSYKSLPFGSTRDLLFIYGNQMIRCNTMNVNRKKEADYLLREKKKFDDFHFINLQTYNHTFNDEDEVCDSNIKFRDHDYIINYYNTNKSTAKEIIPSIDGANILKIGNLIYGNVSNMNMIAGFLEIEKHLSNDYSTCKFKMMSICRKHIDGTIVVIRPGLLLLHSGMEKSWERVLPIEIRYWDKIFYYTDDVDLREFNSSDIHTYGSTDINCLSLNENLVCVLDYAYPYLSKQLSKYGIECVPVKLRHQWLWGGALHCITNELERDGNFECYV